MNSMSCHWMKSRMRQWVTIMENLCSLLMWQHTEVRVYYALGHAYISLALTERTTSYHHTALSEISIRILGKILLRTIWYQALFFFQCGVYKYCCLVYVIVWCKGKVRSASCTRTMECISHSSVFVLSFSLNRVRQHGSVVALQLHNAAKGLI